MSYKKRSTQTLALPSGATVCVRKPALSDFLAVGLHPGNLPQKKQPGDYTPKDLETLNAYWRMVLSRCCHGFEFEGERLKIVTTPESKDDEITIEELDQQDAEAMMARVNELMIQEKEAAVTATTFPEAQSHNGGESAPNGKALRPETVSPCEVGID